MLATAVFAEILQHTHDLLPSDVPGLRVHPISSTHMVVMSQLFCSTLVSPHL